MYENAKVDYWHLQKILAATERSNREFCEKKIGDWMEELEVMLGGEWRKKEKTVVRVWRKWTGIKEKNLEEEEERRERRKRKREEKSGEEEESEKKKGKRRA